MMDSRMLFRSLLMLTSILTTLNAAPTVANCDPKSVFQIDSLSLTPNGANSTLKMTYTVPSEITDGLAKYSCTLNGIPVLSESKPLCQDLKCPITVGQHEDVSDSANPTVTGTLVCTIKWQSLAAESLLCMKLTNVNSECAP